MSGGELLQERAVTVSDGVIEEYEATKGDRWISGYDERVADMLVDGVNFSLPDGRYSVTFRPVGTDKGWDAVSDLRVKNLSTGRVYYVGHEGTELEKMLRGGKGV